MREGFPEKYEMVKLPCFPKYENGRLETTFFSQITFGVVGRGSKWSNLPQFHKGGPCREQQEGEITNQKRCLAEFHNVADTADISV